MAELRLTLQGSAALRPEQQLHALLALSPSELDDCIDTFSRWSYSFNPPSASANSLLFSCPSYSIPSCSIQHSLESCMPQNSLFSSLPSLSSESLGFEQAASLWIWCPCSCQSSLSSSALPCPMGDRCNDKNSGDGTWLYLAGEEALGPPCITGDYYGQISIISLCPTRDPNCSTPSSSAPVSSIGVCDNVLADWPPAAWQFDKTVCGDPADRYIPDIIISEKTAGDAGAWSWCPCLPDYSGYPYSGSSSLSCPYAGDTCDSGDGYWAFRGGNANAPVPCVVGRFYGETIFTGSCCSLSSISSSSLSSLSSLSSFSSLSSSAPSISSVSLSWSVCEDTGFDAPSCSMPPPEQCSLPSQPSFGPVSPMPSSSGAMEPLLDLLETDCEQWIWCPCNCASYGLPVVHGDCPQTVTCQDATTGWWVPFSSSNTSPPPCTVGRFFGEVVWVCTCEICSISSLSSSLSSSSFSSSSIGGALLLLAVTELAGPVVPAVLGTYSVNGEALGQPRYLQDGGSYWIVYDGIQYGIRETSDPNDPPLFRSPGGIDPAGVYIVNIGYPGPPPTGTLNVAFI